ncbi:hypothetical protein [Lysinibacillus sp. 54212]|uniref:hypothetical protein n=1 Tax=Lysinibacillus sp. 54212 TaxID=3119829 RepID=UPI002FC7A31B
MSEKKDEQVERDVNILDRKINMEELLKFDESNGIVTRRNEPNMRLMAIAWINLMNQS